MNPLDEDRSASVLARLLNHSRTSKEEYQSLLIRYVGERFLYRLGKSTYRDAYILKGAYLLSLTLEDQTFRSTKDIDFLKTGNTETWHILESLRSICSVDYPEDAVTFDTDSISLLDIREHNAYQGQRAKIQTHIGQARVMLQIDIGIGDSIYPQPVGTTIPALLEMEEAVIKTYPIETVIAEKLEAIIALGLLTSRMKDFYDLYIISRTYSLEYEDVLNAVRRTFERRSTAFPIGTPIVLTDLVAQDSAKQTQWKAFTRKLRNEYSNLELADVIDRISVFSNVFWSFDTAHPRVWKPDSLWG